MQKNAIYGATRATDGQKLENKAFLLLSLVSFIRHGRGGKHKLLRRVVFLLLFLAGTTAWAQPTITWQKSLGGSETDLAYSIQQTIDGGYIVAGFWGIYIDEYETTIDKYLVVKLDGSGKVLWQKSLGGNNDDEARSIQQTADGGYIVAGSSWSNDGDVTGHHGTSHNSDYWIVKLDGSGNLLWQKSLGGSGNDEARSIQQTADGGYIVAGHSQSNDGDVTGNHGSADYWIVKLDGSGKLLWQKSLGGSGNDEARSIQQTADGGYIVAGHSQSNDGDVTGNHGSADYWIVKLDGSGKLLWQKSLGGGHEDIAYSIQQTTDGGYIVAGSSWSNDGDVTGNHGSADYWIVKLDGSGKLLWQKALGGSFYEFASSIQQTADGGYIVAGNSGSNNGDVSGHHGWGDYWVVKLNSSGKLLWQKALGGSFEDIAYSIKQTTDDGYIVAGWSESNDGDVSGSIGGFNYWVVKLGPDLVNTYYRDADNDGHGNPLESTQASSPPEGYVSDNTDCDDTRANVHPMAQEVCDGLDNNCDGKIDDLQLSIKDFTLVNADTDQDILQLQEGAVLDLSKLPKASLTIRANPKPERIGSVVFSLSGALSYKHTENGAPYALFGGKGEDVRGGALLPGEYTLTATPYCRDKGSGTKGSSTTIHFKVVYGAAVTRFTLVDATTKEDIQELREGEVLTLSTLPTKELSIRAYTAPDTVGSVLLSLSGGQQHQQTENLTPYALFGGSKGSYIPWTPQSGSYLLSAVPYSATQGRGTKGTSLGLHFTVINDILEPCTTPGFAPVVHYPSNGNYNTSLTSGDFNGDGKVDLAVVFDLVLEDLGVLLGKGDGSFAPIVKYHSGSEAGGASSVATGDFNGDRKPDLVVTNYAGTVAVLPGRGDGSFGTALSFPAGGISPRSVAVGDVSGDGRADLVVASFGEAPGYAGVLSVLLGKGDGSFTQAVSYSSGGSGAQSVALNDLNQDGWLDAVVANYHTGTVGVLLGKGDGSFSEAVTYDSGGSGARQVAAHDFSGDGALDIAVLHTLSDALGLLKGDGQGGFAAVETFTCGGNLASSFSIGDFNGDATMDVAVTNSFFKTLTLLEGDGKGSFAEAGSFATGSSSPNASTTSDFNGDGKADMAVVHFTINAPIGVLLNNCRPTLPLVETYSRQTPFPETRSVSNTRLRTDPNPFTSQSTVRFSVPRSGYATLSVYDAKGTEVKRLYQGHLQAGQQYSNFFESKGLAAGTYLLRLVTQEAVMTQKLVLIR